MKETPQQKYQRLLHEVQELTTEVEKIKVTIYSPPQLFCGFCSRGRAPQQEEEDSLSPWIRVQRFPEFGNIHTSTFRVISMQSVVLKTILMTSSYNCP